MLTKKPVSLPVYLTTNIEVSGKFNEIGKYHKFSTVIFHFIRLVELESLISIILNFIAVDPNNTTVCFVVVPCSTFKWMKK